MKHERHWVAAWIFAATIGVSLPAFAQEEPADESQTEEPPAEGTAEVASEEGTAEEPAAEDAPQADNSPLEEDGKTYNFVGLRYRGIIIPKFVLDWFLDGAESLYISGIGPEYVIRKDGFEYNLSSWLAFYGMDPTRLKGSGEPPHDWSETTSTLKILYFTLDMMGSQQLKPKLSWVYGGGAGIGLVFGSIIRNELTGAPGAPISTWRNCLPGEMSENCSGDHPPNYSEPTWFDGGSKPVFYPWVSLQTGLRWKPHKKFVGRLELGLALFSGVFFGLAADYGL